MTTTKEDQMLDEFNAWVFNPNSEGYPLPNPHSAMAAWMACAEYYENKLAEKDAAIAQYKNDQVLAADVDRKLSEANARNAMLAEAMMQIQKRAKEAMEQRVLVEIGTRVVDIQYISNKAITANSKSVAAWEAEKLTAIKGKE